MWILRTRRKRFSRQRGATMSKDPERIYLTPHCGSIERCCEPERLWAEDPVTECSECELPPVEYLLADRYRPTLRRVCDSLATFVRESSAPASEAVVALYEAQRLLRLLQPAGRGNG
jgi:hypothetical protein